jgi:hypothetical protein
VADDTDLTIIKVHLAELSGKLDTVVARMEAGDRQSSQLVSLVKDQLTYQAADLGELKAGVRELAEKNERSISAVRLDLETRIDSVSRDTHGRIDTVVSDVLDLKLWKARIGGIAAASALLGSAMSAAVIKLLGA